MAAPNPNLEGLQRLQSYGFAPTGILDIGAYNGDWSRTIRGLYPTAYVLMIDGLAEKEPMLRQACTEIGNADYATALLGADERASTSFFVVHADGNQTGSSIYRENRDCPIEERSVRQWTLNALLDRLPNQRFQMMKLDVQGTELDVLAGAGRHLDHVQVIMMEVATLPYNANAPLVADVLSRLLRLGFVLFDVMDQLRFGNGALFQFDALFVRPDVPFRPRPPYY